ncbi:NAC domain-containing protein 53-like [Spinacia oleracea]|uniref:NAC domain-containing protein 53-like n=1 Tax=Spinacia oleracea TaxID=3562 RepID=A0ABM3RRM1_SPIOL|nr:NAC domain-containing protein 53-like [Spinacia oleracea]
MVHQHYLIVKENDLTFSIHTEHAVYTGMSGGYLQRRDNDKLPPGMRFTPTNEELIVYYLKHKILGKPLGRHMIADMDVYNFEPWDLSSFSPIKSKERQWYFFCPRGTSKKRQTREVNWKYRKGIERTNWMMKEYILNGEPTSYLGVYQKTFVICRIYEKCGAGHKNGETYEAPFVEEDWEGKFKTNDAVEPSTLMATEVVASHFVANMQDPNDEHTFWESLSNIPSTSTAYNASDIGLNQTFMEMEENDTLTCCSDTLTTRYNYHVMNRTISGLS